MLRELIFHSVWMNTKTFHLFRFQFCAFKTLRFRTEGFNSKPKQRTKRKLISGSQKSVTRINLQPCHPLLWSLVNCVIEQCRIQKDCGPDCLLGIIIHSSCIWKHVLSARVVLFSARKRPFQEKNPNKPLQHDYSERSVAVPSPLWHLLFFQLKEKNPNIWKWSKAALRVQFCCICVAYRPEI